ncbi:MAG: winged helix-turn-helix transcriptional regulator [Rhodobacter sp.]|nr:winged helix-turn-helix transcriptional regulator [Paracoccaceae bacterium]MCB1408318.1 winged helix-turn-helix transcriptional regulator [Paracoccaceae bacterium]MCC0074254.1 winged helix-turn-helix transcriptional regulator [Rhodobacter sp.]
MAPDGHNAEGTQGSPSVDRSCAPYAVAPETLAAEAREASDFLKALGHEGRLLMLYHLCERDHTVTELEQLIMSRQAAVSQQLARLRHEKLVTTRRDGNQIIYSLADPKVREMIAVIQRLFRGA